MGEELESREDEIHPRYPDPRVQARAHNRGTFFFLTYLISNSDIRYIKKKNSELIYGVPILQGSKSQSKAKDGA